MESYLDRRIDPLIKLIDDRLGEHIPPLREPESENQQILEPRSEPAL
jgi:hypothetical protein